MYLKWSYNQCCEKYGIFIIATRIINKYVTLDGILWIVYTWKMGVPVL